MNHPTRSFQDNPMVDVRLLGATAKVMDELARLGLLVKSGYRISPSLGGSIAGNANFRNSTKTEVQASPEEYALPPDTLR